MKPILAWAVALVALSAVAVAQHGSAGNGYFPMGYAGDTWRGTVTAVNADKREITLTASTKGKEETFVGVLKEGYAVTLKDGSRREVQMTDIPPGTYMLAYYMRREKKVDGRKISFYEIFDFRLSKSPPEQD